MAEQPPSSADGRRCPNWASGPLVATFLMLVRSRGATGRVRATPGALSTAAASMDGPDGRHLNISGTLPGGATTLVYFRTADAGSCRCPADPHDGRRARCCSAPVRPTRPTAQTSRALSAAVAWHLFERRTFASEEHGARQRCTSVEWSCKAVSDLVTSFYIANTPETIVGPNTFTYAKRKLTGA